jgi:Cu2+-exporting ATPase
VACWWWWQTDPERAMMVAVAVLVVTCPCALSLATPAAMLAAAGNLARQGVMVRNLRALEALSEVDTVVFDKTGTLTKDAMTVGRVDVRSGTAPEQALQMAAALAAHSLHPASKALLAASRLPAHAAPVWVCEAVTEFAGQGVEGHALQGSSNHLLRLGSDRFCGVDSNASDSLYVFMRDAQGWLATFEVREEVREDAAQAVAALNRAGVHVHLLSGDGGDSVNRVAAETGIENARGSCSPADKLILLRGLQAQGRKVAMVGDGLNDGPVLAGAHASFAFGRAVPLAQAQSDFIVMGEQLTAVVQALQLARKTMSVVRQNLWWALLYNVACVPLAIVGLLPAWLAGLGMACSSLVVVANALRLTATVHIPKGA